MHLLNRYAWACLATALLCGCSTTAMPQWCNPAPASVQLAEARQYDPFPDPSIAPPIMGGRPLGFRVPRPEPDVTKNRRYWMWPFAGYSQPGAAMPPPAMPPPAAPGVVPYPPAMPGPIPGNVAYPPAAAPYDPYAAPGSAPAAYGTAIPQ